MEYMTELLDWSHSHYEVLKKKALLDLLRVLEKAWQG
jgi:hypothetical protein